MASCVCFCQCSRRACLALLVPISAALSCSHGSFLIIPLTFIFLSTIFLFTLSKTKPIQENEPLQEENDSSAATEAVEGPEGGSEEATLMGMGISQQDMMLYSESESMDHFSSSEGEQRLDFSDGSISDEESDLIEIAIPSGQFLWNVKCCKHLPQDLYKAEMNHEMNEEEDDNLFEIDINI